MFWVRTDVHPAVDASCVVSLVLACTAILTAAASLCSKSYLARTNRHISVDREPWFWAPSEIFGYLAVTDFLVTPQEIYVPSKKIRNFLNFLNLKVQSKVKYSWNSLKMHRQPWSTGMRVLPGLFLWSLVRFFMPAVFTIIFQCKKGDERKNKATAG